ncbi:MAG: hypothetical protein ABI605_18165, partial [Rhizobacter sp.]
IYSPWLHERGDNYLDARRTRQGKLMIHTSQIQRETQQPSSALRELNLDELRAVAGGLVVQNTRPDPVIYPYVQNNSE